MSMQLEALAGQLLRVEVFEPWGGDWPPQQQQSPLPNLVGGGVALHFETGSLVCTSTLRYRENQAGTMFGMSSGAMVSLGFRASVCAVDEVQDMMALAIAAANPCRSWCAWRRTPFPVAVGATLASASVEGRDELGRLAPWAIRLDFEPACVLLLHYRLDLDGAVELRMPGHHTVVSQLEVLGPTHSLGWLHPAAPIPFVIGQRVWPSASMSAWPVALRRALQCSPEPAATYWDTLTTVLRARFVQHPGYLRRLRALAYPVSCQDLPQGLVEALVRSLNDPGLNLAG